MQALAFALIAIAHGCFWMIYRLTGDIDCLEIKFDLYVGEPDALGAYELVSLSKFYGPKSKHKYVA